MDAGKRKIEFGDFQTPEALAITLCERLTALGLKPDVVVEPTCGVGAFILAAVRAFPGARSVLGFEVNREYLHVLAARLYNEPTSERVTLEQADFFSTDWRAKIDPLKGNLLILGNFPWVTNATQGALGSGNLPQKSNFLGHAGFDAISGKANFDISESMLLEVLRWFQKRSGDIAMLVKTAVARKVLAHAERHKDAVREAFIIGIDAKKSFDASVDACLLVVRLCGDRQRANYDYTVFANLDDNIGTRVGHRDGLTVADLHAFGQGRHLLGNSPEKWRSGVKHDAAAVMEFTDSDQGLVNGLGEAVLIEPDYLYPLLKGSDIGSGKEWRSKWVLVTQQAVGQSTQLIRSRAPATWRYLEDHAAQLDQRASIIYAKNPRFSIFGVGEYAFRPWRVAICGLYKNLRFRLIGPMSGKPVMFDDTVYYLSFDSEDRARSALRSLSSEPAVSLLNSLIFWDEKRPVKTALLNVLDWSKLEEAEPLQPSLL